GCFGSSPPSPSCCLRHGAFGATCGSATSSHCFRSAGGWSRGQMERHRLMSTTRPCSQITWIILEQVYEHADASCVLRLLCRRWEKAPHKRPDERFVRGIRAVIRRTSPRTERVCSTAQRTANARGNVPSCSQPVSVTKTVSLTPTVNLPYTRNAGGM